MLPYEQRLNSNPVGKHFKTKDVETKNCNVDYRNCIDKGKSTVENARLEKDNDCSKHIKTAAFGNDVCTQTDGNKRIRGCSIM